MRRVGLRRVRARRWAGLVAVACTGVLAAATLTGVGAAETPTGTFTGTVADATSGAPVSGAWIVVMRVHDFSPAAEVVADGGGGFSTSLPAGSYYVYLIDPEGDHAPGFWGAPEVVRITDGAVEDAAVTMARTTGDVTGRVTDAVTGGGLSGVWVLALGPSGGPERAVRTDSSGRYALSGLRVGPHRLAFLDPTAAHATVFHDGVTDILSSSALDVAAGASVTADAALPRQSTTIALSSLRGTVTDASSTATLSGVLVLALRATDLRLAGASTTGSNGRYRVSVPVGSYKLAFLDPSGAHTMEWYPNVPYQQVLAAGTVAAPSLNDAALAPSTGELRGTVEDGESLDPVAGAWVLAVDAGGGMRGVSTGPDGAFAISGLPVGTYRAAIIDPTGDRLLQYWDARDQFASADTFTITAGAPTSISSLLRAPNASVLDDAVGWWEASTGLLPDGTLPDLSGHGRDMELVEGYEPSYPPALVAPNPARGRHLFSPGWDDMYLDTPDPAVAITGIDVAWDGDLDQVLEVAAGKDVNWLVHQGSTADGTFAWAVGIVSATGQIEVRWSDDGTTVSSARSATAFPREAQRGAVTVDPATGELTVYHQDPGAPTSAFDEGYSAATWTVLDRVAGNGPVVLFDSDRPIRHSAAIPRDRIGDSMGEGWFEALYRLRVRAALGGANVADLDLDLVPAEPVWRTEVGLPPLFPENESGEARSTTFPGGVGEEWTIHNYTTSSYPILFVDRPYVLFGNHSYGRVDGRGDDFRVDPGEDLSVWIAYAYPREGSGSGPFVARKRFSLSGTTPGWMLLGSPFFAGPSAVVGDGGVAVYDPAPPVSDSHLDLSGFQIDGAAGTIRSYSNGTPSAEPVSIAGLGTLDDPDLPLTVAGYGDNGVGGPSFAFAALVVFDRQLTQDEIDRLPVELGLTAG